jgi:hypothetical protein
MRDLVILLVHVIPIILRLVRPGGAHAVVAESVLAKYQLLILDRSRQRAPNLRVSVARVPSQPILSRERHCHPIDSALRSASLQNEWNICEGQPERQFLEKLWQS